MTASEYSQRLVRHAKQFYGSPACTFIEMFAEEFEHNVERVKKAVSLIPLKAVQGRSFVQFNALVLSQLPVNLQSNGNSFHGVLNR